MKTSFFPALSEGEVRPCVLSGLPFLNGKLKMCVCVRMRVCGACMCACVCVCMGVFMCMCACMRMHMFREQTRRLLLACPLSSLGRPKHKEANSGGCPLRHDRLIRDSQRGIVCFRLSCGLWLHLWGMPLTDVGRPIPNVDGMVW